MEVHGQKRSDSWLCLIYTSSIFGEKQCSSQLSLAYDITMINISKYSNKVEENDNNGGHLFPPNRKCRERNWL